jgi:photosystem II stability/assembly factor-like uncharacterized protein
LVPFFVVDYLTLIDNNAIVKVMIHGVAAQARNGEFEGFGGWTTNQSEFFYDNHLGWRLYSGVGVDANAPAYFQRTQDGGNTWESIMPVPWQSVRFQFVDPQEGWSFVTLPWGKALIHTADGGQTWNEIKPTLHP